MKFIRNLTKKEIQICSNILGKLQNDYHFEKISSDFYGGFNHLLWTVHFAQTIYIYEILKLFKIINWRK